MKTTKRNKGRQGFALATVMGLLLVLSVILGIMATLSGQSAFTARRMADTARAQAIAEAGVHEAYSIISTNYTLRTNTTTFPRTRGFAGGAYTAWLVTNAAGASIIHGTGRFGDSEVEVILDAVRAPGPNPSNPPPTDAYGYAILSDKTMQFKGNGTLSAGNAKIHSNQDFFMNGCGVAMSNLTACLEIRTVGSSKIRGNARTATAFTGKSPGNVTGLAVVGPVATFTAWPELPLDTFRQWADGNKMYLTTDQHWTSSRTITGGVLYVKGTFKYSGSEDLVGCIIAENGITWSGSGSQIKTNQYPALVTTEPGAGIDISGNGTFHGLIYAMKGPFEKTGNGLVTGTILARGTWDKGGGWDAMAYEYSYPTPPGVPPGTGQDQVFVSAWQK